mgnify:CR=1 FL=1
MSEFVFRDFLFVKTGEVGIHFKRDDAAEIMDQVFIELNHVVSGLIDFVEIGERFFKRSFQEMFRKLDGFLISYFTGNAFDILKFDILIKGSYLSEKGFCIAETSFSERGYQLESIAGNPEFFVFYD